MTKYESLRKTKRDQLIVRFTTKHPELSYKEIGKVYRLSRGRICQIMQEVGAGRRRKEN